jgi:hypothetical protein
MHARALHCVHSVYTFIAAAADDAERERINTRPLGRHTCVKYAHVISAQIIIHSPLRCTKNARAVSYLCAHDDDDATLANTHMPPVRRGWIYDKQNFVYFTLQSEWTLKIGRINDIFWKNFFCRILLITSCFIKKNCVMIY